MDALCLKQSNEYIYIFSKSKGVIFKYKDPLFGALLALFHGEDNLTPLQESDLPRFDCEIVEV